MARGQRGLDPRLALAIGVSSVSSASVLIKLSNAPAMVIAANRLLIAAAIMSLVSLPSLLRSVEVVEGLLPHLAASGIALAVHFATWVTSLKYTSVAVSVVLVDSAPMFAAVLGWALLGDRITLREAVGIALGMLGAAAIVGEAWTLTERDLLGATLALAGAVALALYLVAGRALRRSLDTLSYAASVYGVSGLALAAGALSIGSPLTGYPFREYAIFLALALGPSCVGHTLYNYALKYVKAHVVSLAILMEPIGATVLAWVVLGEVPSLRVVIGGAVLLAGVTLAVTGSERG